METLSIKKSDALKAFNEGGSTEKKLLSNLFGKEVFNQKITDRVKTFDDACEILGIDFFNTTLEVSCGLGGDEKSILAYTKLIIIARALNEGWTPDWSNSNETKYYPWLEYKSGLGFSYSHYAYSHSHTPVGSRLCFKSRDMAIYAGTQFRDIYNDFFNL